MRNVRLIDYTVMSYLKIVSLLFRNVWAYSHRKRKKWCTVILVLGGAPFPLALLVGLSPSSSLLILNLSCVVNS